MWLNRLRILLHRDLRPYDGPRVLFALVVVASLLLFHVSPVTPGLEPLPPDDRNDTSVRLWTGSCNGSCPIFVVEICGDGTVHYLGYEYVNVTGYRELSIPRERAQRLVDRSYEINYFRLRSKYSPKGDDFVRVMTRVRIGDRSHTVRDYSGAGPRRLAAFERAILEVVEPLYRGGDASLDHYPEPNWTCG